MKNRIKPKAKALMAEREAKQAERRLAKERQRAGRRTKKAADGVLGPLGATTGLADHHRPYRSSTRQPPAAIAHVTTSG